MKNRPIIVHSLEDARAAVAVAAELGLAVTLRSAPGAEAYLGAQVSGTSLPRRRRPTPPPR